MKRAVLLGSIILSVPSAALAGIEKLSEVAWWAAHGGTREDGATVCAMVSATPDGREGKFVIEHVGKSKTFAIRLLKPNWTIPTGTRANATIQFGYVNEPWQLALVGSNTELRGELSLNSLPRFLDGFSNSGRIDIAFGRGNETPWVLTTAGAGFVRPDFERCIRMKIPVRTAPPTQPF